MSGINSSTNTTTRIAIIGGGPSGCICAYFLLKWGFEVTVFDKGNFLRTILPTGGGRCNLAHAEYDFKELAKNYPRGEKFLYSIFSKFSTYDTISLFEELEIPVFTQYDNRIFPKSNSAKDVRTKILKAIRDAQFIKEKVTDIYQLDNGYKIITQISSNKKSQYFFTHVIIATGGHSGYKILDDLNLNIINPKPSLVGLNTDIKVPAGIVLKDVYAKDLHLTGDLLFTHFGISGPLAYKISSLNARKDFPYKITFDLHNKNFNLQNLLNSNPHKNVKNILSTIFPHTFAKYILGNLAETKAHTIDGKTRELILNNIHNFELTITGPNIGEETVTAGGVDLKEINPKTMECKKYPKLYCIGEVLDIDGFCGGFNLQNAWSTAFNAAESIKQTY